MTQPYLLQTNLYIRSHLLNSCGNCKMTKFQKKFEGNFMLLTFSVENCKNICEKSYFQDVNYKFQKLFFHKQNLFMRLLRPPLLSFFNVSKKCFPLNRTTILQIAIAIFFNIHKSIK